MKNNHESHTVCHSQPIFKYIFQASEGKHEVSKECEARVMAPSLLAYDECCNAICDSVFRLK